MYEIEKYDNYYKMKGVKRKYLFGVIRYVDFVVKKYIRCNMVRSLETEQHLERPS